MRWYSESGRFIHLWIFESVLIQGHRDPDGEEETFSLFRFHPAGPTIDDSIWIEFLTRKSTFIFWNHRVFPAFNICLVPLSATGSIDQTTMELQ